MVEQFPDYSYKYQRVQPDLYMWVLIRLGEIK